MNRKCRNRLPSDGGLALETAETDTAAAASEAEIVTVIVIVIVIVTVIGEGEVRGRLPRAPERPLRGEETLVIGALRRRVHRGAVGGHCQDRPLDLKAGEVQGVPAGNEVLENGTVMVCRHEVAITADHRAIGIGIDTDVILRSPTWADEK